MGKDESNNLICIYLVRTCIIYNTYYVYVCKHVGVYMCIMY